MIFGPKADGIFRTRQLPPGVGYIPQAVAAAQCSDRRRTGASVCASRLIPGDHCLKLGLCAVDEHHETQNRSRLGSICQSVAADSTSLNVARKSAFLTPPSSETTLPAIRNLPSTGRHAHQFFAATSVSTA